MTDRSQREPVETAFDPDDLRRLDALCEMLAMGRGSLIRQCVRMGLAEIEKDPKRFLNARLQGGSGPAPAPWDVPL